MQFRGHSLPVHQSMSVSWDFYLVPFHQPNLPTRSLSITGHWNVSLPSGASLWNGMFGWVEGQNTTIFYSFKCISNMAVRIKFSSKQQRFYENQSSFMNVIKLKLLICKKKLTKYDPMCCTTEYVQQV